MPLRNSYILFLLFSFLIIAHKVIPNSYTQPDSSPESILYKCPPCGCTEESTIFAAPGDCPGCGMKLIPLNSGVAGAIDQWFAPLFSGPILSKLYTKILYPIFLAGIVFSLIFFGRALYKKNLNVFLIGIILVLSLYGFKNQLYGTGHQLTDNSKNLFFPISFIALLGPFIFFYIKSSINSSFSWRKMDWIHGIPAAIIAILYSLGFLLPEKTSIHFMSSPFEVAISHTEQTLSAIIGGIYLISAHRFYKIWSSDVANQNPRLIAWLKRFRIGMSLLFSFWGLLIFLNYWLYDLGIATVSNYPLWIVFGVILVWVGIEILRQPQLILHSVYNNIKNTSSQFNGDVHTYQKKLEDLMNQEKLYKDQNLNLEKLAENMGINPRSLSAFLNNNVGKSFYELINYYRVEEVKFLLKAPENNNLTIEAIAQIAGFKSKSTFNAAFKKLNNMTPRQFLKKTSETDSINI